MLNCCWLFSSTVLMLPTHRHPAWLTELSIRLRETAKPRLIQRPPLSPRLQRSGAVYSGETYGLNSIHDQALQSLLQPSTAELTKQSDGPHWPMRLPWGNLHRNSNSSERLSAASVGVVGGNGQAERNMQVVVAEMRLQSTDTRTYRI